jgi:hypothetical protein
MRLLCLVIALAFLAAIAPDSWGQSKQPSSQSKPSTQPAAADQRGTDQVPLAIKILPAAGAQEQADKAEHERKEKAVIDEKTAFETQRIADYTDRLATFTIALFCVAVLQAGLFVWQLGYMRAGMKDATVAARAAKRSAVATVAQAKITRDSVISIQRPYIFAFDVHRLERRGDSDWIVKYSAANYGTIPAVIEDVFVGFETNEQTTRPEPNRASDDHGLFTSPILASNEMRPHFVEHLPSEFLTGVIIVVLSDGEGDEREADRPEIADGISFRIVIRYRGPFTRGHETSAMWRVRTGLGDLIPHGGNEKNYNR